MNYLIFFALVALLLCTRGSGTLVAALAILAALSLTGMTALSVPAFLAALAIVFSGPLAARLAVPYLNPLFQRGVPDSVCALLTAGGYLFMLEHTSAWSALTALSHNGFTVGMGGALLLLGEIVCASMLIAALALSFVALVELPCAWIFRAPRSASVRWAAALRPLLLVFFIGMSMSQVGRYMTDMIDRSSESVSGERSLHE